MALVYSPFLPTRVYRKARECDFIVVTSGNQKKKPVLICNNKKAQRLARSLTGRERFSETNFAFDMHLPELIGKIKELIKKTGKEIFIKNFPGEGF
ncbi:MAG: hypothetical protein GF370_04910 [Candidatus Nealsonbacteria bacterium]|nr:hypothetical protein [Candidatus Nealsonbacteria bacterium]